MARQIRHCRSLCGLQDAAELVVFALSDYRSEPSTIDEPNLEMGHDEVG